MTDSSSVISGETRWTVIASECLDALRAMPDACVDAIVTDPPAGIAFMNAAWDKDKGGRNEWIAWLASVFVELRRVAKPGAHALVWALPRTSHWTATAIEDAGWQIRDRVAHIFASGFPKSQNVSKAIDRANGDVRQVTGPDPYETRRNKGAEKFQGTYGTIDAIGKTCPVTSAATAASAAWDGWGTALKPAVEDWWLARKPPIRTIAENVLAHGTGAINIDACRIAHADAADLEAHEKMVAAIKARGGTMDNSWKNSSDLAGASDVSTAGRWPAHLALSHSDGCVEAGTHAVKTGTAHRSNGGGNTFGGATAKPLLPDMSYAGPNGTETVAAWTCVDGCPVRMLDEQSEGASRFFFTAKPSTSERERGVEWMEPTPASRARRNVHPTVKAQSLMRWLCRLITPPNGIILDPFAGSGSTIVAALAENFRAIGIEQKEEFAQIARARIVGDAPLLNRQQADAWDAP